MWSPTHVQILVKRAKGLKIKGKDGTNDAFVTIGLGKEKYQTSVKEKATESAEWCEQCELTIPQQGNTAEIVLNVLHRNFMGVDEFLGMIALPLRDFDVYERPKTKWYPLKCKPGQSKTDYRGELEVRTSFTVKAVTEGHNPDKVGSTADLSSKHKKGSLTSLNKAVGSFGGSLLSLGKKEGKHIKKLAKSVTHKVEKVGNKARTSLSSQHRDQQQRPSNLPNKLQITPRSKRGPNHDPGVNSDDEDDDFEGDLDEDDMFRFDALSHRSSGQSINANDNLGTVSKTSTPISGSFENVNNDVLLKKSFKRSGLARGSQSPLVTSSTPSSTLPRSNQGADLNNSKDEPVLDDWEQKLLGKKGAVPYVAKSNSETQSLSSANSRNNTLERQRRHLPLNELGKSTLSTPQEETPSGRRKKIIPVGSDFDSSPSPENPNSPMSTPKTEKSFDDHDVDNKSQDGGDKKKKKLNFKWKSNVSFKDKDGGPKKLRGSNESLNKSHSRTHSDVSGSSHNGVPTGTRVAPLGRENTPTPNVPQRIPKEVWDRFEGKSREDLIETIVQLQSQLEIQVKRQGDMEDYLDSLLMKVMKCAPELLQKNITLSNNNAFVSPSTNKKGLFSSWVMGRR